MGGPAPLSSTRRFDSESPIRWPVRPFLGDAGLCGSERGEFPDHGRAASSNESGAACRLPEDAPRAKAESGAEASQRHPFFRESPLASQLERASTGRHRRASARRAATRSRHENHRRAPARARASRSAAARQRATQGRDLSRFRATLLRSSPEGRVVRVASFDGCAEWPVSRALPDGLERASTLRARSESTPAGDRSAQVLRPVGSGLEPVELQAVVRILLGLATFAGKGEPSRRQRVSFSALFC